jgi:hypothetical protein
MRLGSDYAPVVREGRPNKRDGLNYYNSWWDEQIGRITNGWTTPWGEYVDPDMYFYLNFGTIEGFLKASDTRKSPMRPLYLDGQHGWFLSKEGVIQKQRAGLPGKAGLVTGKGRRKGYTWMVEHMVLRRLITQSNSRCAIGSDGEVSQGYVKDFRLKLLFSYQHLPNELKACIDTKRGAINNSDLIKSQYKDTVDGRDQIFGLESEVHFKNTSNPSCFKGLGLDLGVIEEAGEVGFLREAIDESKDCYKEGDMYYGLQLVGGTSNKIKYDSEDFQNLMLNPEAADFSSYFFPAQVNYYPCYSRETGKSDEVAAAKLINDEAERLKAAGDLKSYYSHRQNNPTKVEDMFNIYGGGRLSIEHINRQLGYLMSMESVREKVKRGRLEWIVDAAGKTRKDKAPIFEEDPMGNWEMYLGPHTVPGYEVSAIDSYYLSNEFGGGADTDSKGAMCVFRQFVDMRTTGRLPVAIYHGRPSTKTDWYEETAKGNMYYGIKRKCLVEYNDEELLRWYVENGYENQLMLRPASADAPNSVAANRYGVHMKGHQKDLLTRLLDEYVKQSAENIMFTGLLKELSVYGLKNTDRAITFGLCLLADFASVSYPDPTEPTEKEIAETRKAMRPQLIDQNGVPVMIGQRTDDPYRQEPDGGIGDRRWANLL